VSFRSRKGKHYIVSDITDRYSYYFFKRKPKKAINKDAKSGNRPNQLKETWRTPMDLNQPENGHRHLFTKTKILFGSSGFLRLY
jgi:hypothetical protein